MPKIFVTCPEGAFSREARDELAGRMTDIALECEELPGTPFVRSTVWIYFRELAAGYVYHGGAPGGTHVVSVEVNAFEGGLDASGKTQLIERFTDAIGTAAGMPPDGRVPAYIVIRDVPAANWGVFGRTVTLDELRNPDPDVQPI